MVWFVKRNSEHRVGNHEILRVASRRVDRYIRQKYSATCEIFPAPYRAFATAPLGWLMPETVVLITSRKEE
jgi:hypothetical protein